MRSAPDTTGRCARSPQDGQILRSSTTSVEEVLEEAALAVTVAVRPRRVGVATSIRPRRVPVRPGRVAVGPRRVRTAVLRLVGRRLLTVVRALRTGDLLKLTAIEEELVATPADTMADVLAKARILTEWERQGIAGSERERFLAGSLNNDLERRFGITGGNIFHGEMSLDQMFSMRPVAGWARYRTPVPGLYLCGSGAHPGGGITGAPGLNAARAILADARQGRRRSAMRHARDAFAVKRAAD